MRTMTLDLIVPGMVRAGPARWELTRSIQIVSNGTPDGLILEVS
jgi:hypothetical protein